MSVVLRLVVALGASLAVVPTSPPPWLMVVTAVCAIGWATWPASGFGLAALALATVAWAYPEPSFLLLPTALAMLAAHLAAAVLAHGPRDWWPDGALLRLWALRGTALWLSAPLLYLVVAGFDDLELAGIWALGLAVAVALVAAGRIALDRSPHHDEA